jgi:hypothetical protein
VPVVFGLVAVWLTLNTLHSRPIESLAGLVLTALGLPVCFCQCRSVVVRINLNGKSETQNQESQMQP